MAAGVTDKLWEIEEIEERRLRILWRFWISDIRRSLSSPALKRAPYMDFLKPPTDNLYKFLAMSGLLLFLVSMTYPPWLYYRLNISIYELEKDSKILELEAEAEQTRRKDFKAALDVIRADGDDTRKEVENLKRLLQSQPSRAKVALEQKRRLLQARVEEIDKQFHEKSAHSRRHQMLMSRSP
jgi:hypothetical protein